MRGCASHMNGFIVKRVVISWLLVGGLVLPGGALAASVTGTVAVAGQSSVTVETPGRAVGVVNALASAADRITRADLPYVYGGGHAQAGVASVGVRAHGHNGRRVGYDCSGSVAAVLGGAGLRPAGAGVPNDAGVIQELLAARLIAPGAGTGPVEVTLYDHPGVHIFMNIDGRFFGTSDGAGGGNPRGGAGWLDDGAPDASSRAYRRYHVLPSVLRASTNAGHSVTFQLGGLDTSQILLEPGVRVQVTYRQTREGTLEATAVSYPGTLSASGVVSAVGDDGSSLTLQGVGGSSLTFVTGAVSGLLQNVVVGDTIQVKYVKTSTGLVPVALSVTAPPAAPVPSGTGSPADAGSGSPASTPPTS